MGRRSENTTNLASGMEGMRANYEAAKVGRFRRQRTGILLTGSSSDYHYRNVFDYLRIMEYARDMDRNDCIVGQMVDRAVLNTIQDGLTVDPKTGDDGINTEIRDMWKDWAEDPRQCDLAGEHTFTDIEEFAFRHMVVDGDNFVIPLESGEMQFVEAHRVRTPTGTKRNIVCGILLDDYRRPVEYWITKDDVDPFMPVALVSEVEKVPAFDSEGNRNVFHVRRGKRKSQTRGISAFAPIFDMVGMHDDIQFAKLVQQQIVSCFSIIRERDTNWKPGGIDPYGPLWKDQGDLSRRITEEIAPGFEARGLPGEKISGFSPNTPNESFFPHARMMLQIIGINLGMPLVMLLMDASETNFSGWRGAMNQAQLGFKRNQEWLIEHFHRPIYLWKLRQFIQKNATLRRAAARLGKKFVIHQWNAPRWPYIQPLQDAQADASRQDNLLVSPRQLHAERNQDWNTVITETVEDNSYAIKAADKEAKALSKIVGEPVAWREVLFMKNIDMLKALWGKQGAIQTETDPTKARAGQPQLPSTPQPPLDEENPEGDEPTKKKEPQ